jgi:AcrR family transcriptional regulator
MAHKLTTVEIPELGGRRERRRRETRERIYRAAVKLFTERGYLETTTEQITEAADVGQGTFFNYFPTKPHVLAVLAEIQLETVQAARHRAERDGARIRTVLGRLMPELTRETGASPALARAVMTAVLSSDAVRELVGQTMVRGRVELAAIMSLGQARGELTRRLTAAQLAMSFQRAVMGTLLLWAVHPAAGLKGGLERALEDFWAASAAVKGECR